MPMCAARASIPAASFVQSYDSKELDASLLLLRWSASCRRRIAVIGTIEAIERRLMVGGFVQRYDTARSDDGLPPGEGVFLACSFWLVDAYVMLGRLDDARALFKRLAACATTSGC
jgi:GH15 family glucan-1,4-alpha-glucosidase